MTLTPAQVVNDPELFAVTFLRILDKNKKLVPLQLNKAQRDFHQHRTGRDLILKARQLGFSTYVQAELFRRAVTSTRTTMTMAHDDETTQKLRRMADRFWEHCKFNGIQPERKYSNATLASYRDFDSECIIATAGSKEAGRGGTYTDFHGSEVAFWKDAEKIIAGAMQGGNPDVILESTPNGTQGYFYERCMEALSGKGVWKIHFYPWWFDSSYRIPLDDGEVIGQTDEEKELIRKHNLQSDQIKWRRNKQEELKRLFIQEYPEDPYTCFLTSGNSYFGDISHVFTAPMGATYQEGHEYRAGLDFGRDFDFLSLTVLDKTTREQVDLLHINQLSWEELRRRVKLKYDYWHLKSVAAESNSIGSVNIEAMRKMGMVVIPFETTNISKAGIASDLYDVLHAEKNWLKLQPHEVQRHELNIFVADQLPSGVWRLAAEGQGHDDTVVSLMIANWAMVHTRWAVM
ncbi:conserved hypothetical protein [Gammaproteobacteria bacterium]